MKTLCWIAGNRPPRHWCLAWLLWLLNLAKLLPLSQAHGYCVSIQDMTYFSGMLWIISVRSHRWIPAECWPPLCAKDASISLFSSQLHVLCCSSSPGPTLLYMENGSPPWRLIARLKTVFLQTWKLYEGPLKRHCQFLPFSSLVRTWPLTSLLVYSAQRSCTYHLRYIGAAFAVLYLKMLVLWLACAVTDLEQAWTCDSHETSVFKLKSAKGSFKFFSIQVSFYMLNIFFNFKRDQLFLSYMWWRLYLIVVPDAFSQWR